MIGLASRSCFTLGPYFPAFGVDWLHLFATKSGPLSPRWPRRGGSRDVVAPLLPLAVLCACGRVCGAPAWPAWRGCSPARTAISQPSVPKTPATSRRVATLFPLMSAALVFVDHINTCTYTSPLPPPPLPHRTHTHTHAFAPSLTPLKASKEKAGRRDLSPCSSRWLPYTSAPPSGAPLPGPTPHPSEHGPRQRLPRRSSRRGSTRALPRSAPLRHRPRSRRLRRATTSSSTRECQWRGEWRCSPHSFAS